MLYFCDMIQINDKLRNKKTNTHHIVESIDRFDDVVLIFTKDGKYIPINDVEFVSESIISNYFIKLLNNEKIDNDLELSCTNKLKKLKLVTINKTKEQIRIDLEVFKNKIKNYQI